MRQKDLAALGSPAWISSLMDEGTTSGIDWWVLPCQEDGCTFQPHEHMQTADEYTPVHIHAIAWKAFFFFFACIQSDSNDGFLQTQSGAEGPQMLHS